MSFVQAAAACLPQRKRRPGGRIGAEHGLDGVGDELGGLGVDGDVTTEQHAAEDLPSVRERVVRAVGHVSSLS